MSNGYATAANTVNISTNTSDIAAMKVKTDVITSLDSGTTYQNHRTMYKNPANGNHIGSLGAIGDGFQFICNYPLLMTATTSYIDLLAPIVYVGGTYGGAAPGRIVLRDYAGTKGYLQIGAEQQNNAFTDADHTLLNSMVNPANKITGFQDLGWFPLGRSVAFDTTSFGYITYDERYNFLVISDLTTKVSLGKWNAGAKRLLITYTWSYTTNSAVGTFRFKLVHKNTGGTILKETPYVGVSHSSNRTDLYLYSNSVSMVVNIVNGDYCETYASYVNITSTTLANTFVGTIQIDEL